MLSIGHYGLITTISDSRFCLKASNPISIGKRPESVKFRTQTGAGKVKAYMKNALVSVSACETSFYELLGVPESGSLVEVKHAYKQLARKYHPDMSPPGRVEEYTKRFIQLHEAYETLSDPTRRAIYDRDIARGIHLAFSSRPRHCYDDQVYYIYYNVCVRGSRCFLFLVTPLLVFSVKVDIFCA